MYARTNLYARLLNLKFKRFIWLNVKFLYTKLFPKCFYNSFQKARFKTISN